MKTLSFEQMEQINAGSWISDAWDWICEAAEATWEWIQDHFVVYFQDGNMYAGFEI